MFGNISIWQMLIVLVIIILLFGTKKLRNVGGDLGGALKNFKKSMKDEEDKAGDNAAPQVEKQDADFQQEPEQNKTANESPVEKTK